MKYIMFETTEGRHMPFLFPEDLVHANVARVMAQLILRDTNQLAAPSTAGFVAIGNGTQAFGESETLKLKSSPADSAYIILGKAVEYMPDIVVQQMLEKVRGR